MKSRILLVDDEPAIADWLRIVLEGEGYDVGVAGDSVSALGQMTEREFSLALVDLVLPDGDGLQLLQQLKSKDPSLEVIIMTGHSSIAKAVEATKQGAFYFVAKPFDSAEMLTLVSKALERRRLLAETFDLKRRLAEQSGLGELLGGSPAMRRMFELLESVAGRTPTCSSWARAAPARSWRPTRCTPRARAPAGPTSRSTARRSPRT